MASPSFISEILVTAEGIPPSPDYGRWAKFSDTYLWAKRTTKENDAITDLKLVFTDEDATDGWTKIATCLVNLPDKKAFLFYKRLISNSPIVELKTVENDKNPGPGYVKLDGDVNLYPPTAGGVKDKIFIAFLTAAAKKKAENAEPEYEANQFIDCLDTVSKWCEARIVEVKPNQVLVHYEGWADSWNEWIPKKSPRLAPHKTHTEGYTGPAGNTSAFLLKGDDLVKFRDCAKKTEAIYLKLKPKMDGPEDAKSDLNTELTKDEITFLTTVNVGFVSSGLNAVVDEPELFPEVVRFFEQNLTIAVYSLKQDAEARIPLFFIVSKILNCEENERFYIKYGVSGDEVLTTPAKWAVRPKSTKVNDNQKPVVLSSYLVNIINFFGDLGGFAAVQHRITKREDSFPALAILIRAMHGIRATLLPEWSKDWVTSLNLDTLVQSRVKRITDDELKALNRNAFQNTAREVSGLLALAETAVAAPAEGGAAAPTSVNTKKKDEFMERLNLDIALRLMICQVLEKRINGITELVETVKKVQAKENESLHPPPPPPTQQQQQNQNPNARLPETAKYLTAEYVIEWINKNNLVESMLGPDSHEQVIKRSPPILKFLAKHNSLTGKHVDELWQSTVGKHEGLVRIVYDCIADLAQELSDDQLSSLYKRIEQTSPSDYTDFFLHFVKTFTINAVRPGKNEWYGVNYFWNLIQDEVKISDELNTMAHTILKELLEKPAFDSQRGVYLGKCLENLHKDASVVSALLVAKSIIELYPPKDLRAHPQQQQQGVNIEVIILHYEKNNGLMNLLLSGFLKYQTRALAAAKAKGGNVTGETVLVGRHTHSSQRSTRLEFLEFVLAHSSISLTQQQVDDLWKAFVLQAVTPDDKSKFLKWLDHAVTETAHSAPAFNQDVARYVFNGLLCNAAKMDYARISPEGFQAFETYFCHINHLGESLVSSDRKHLRVNNYTTLVGMESLWAIAGQTADATVAEAARDLVTQLHLSIDDRLDKKEMYKNFVDKTMTSLIAVKEKAVKGDAASVQLANRYVELLDNFLEACKNRGQFRVTSGGGGGGHGDSMRELNLRDARGNMQNGYGRDLNVRGNEPVTLGGNDYDDNDDEMNTEEGTPMHEFPRRSAMGGDYSGTGSDSFRQDVARETGSFRDPLRDPRTQGQGQGAAAGPEPAQEKDDRDEKEGGRAVEDLSGDAQYPKLILANEKAYFDLLFTILQTGGDLSLKVWNLLSVLPTNKELSDDIKGITTVATPEWDKLLPANPMKLLYALQIVEEHLNPPDDGHKFQSAEFLTSFVGKGGFLRLYILLIQQSDPKQAAGVFAESLRQQCLTLILKLINQLFLDDPTQKADTFFKFDDLVQRLMNLLHFAVHSKITGMKEEKKQEPAPKKAHHHDSYANYSLMGMGGAAMLEQREKEREEKETKEGEVVKNVQKVNTRDIGDLVWSASSLLVAATLKKTSTLDVVYKFDKWEDLVVTGLLNNPVRKLRENLAEGLFQWCTKFDKATVTRAPRAHVLPLLLKCLPYIDTRSAHCAQYFDLIQRLLRDTRAESLVDPEELSRNMSEKIRTHPFIERRASDTDSVLIGLFGLTKELVAQFPALKEKLGSKEHNLIKEVFNCLFDVPLTTMKSSTSNAPPKCKSVLSRKSAFGLLEELAKGCRPNFMLLLDLLKPNHLISHSGGKHPEEWAFESKQEEKSESGYVGLRNLGCICYMNSLCQQIFMIPPLRQDILALDLETKPDKDDDPIYQFQYIMGFLQESEKQYCDPTGFCKSFKDFEGHPINVTIQEDSAGFLNKLVDKFSEKLKGTPGADVFKRNIGGYFANELIGKGDCKHYRESPEEFIALQVEIKNKKNVEEALKALVKGEVISDYRCSDCNKKVEVLKRSCVKTLPETVAIVLKRFALDYETLQTTKLNDRVEFSHTLDLKPYSKGNLPKEDGVPEIPKKPDDGKGGGGEGKDGKKDEDTHPDEYYKYELAGMIVHTGTATGGHYYSYIRERVTDEMLEKGIEPQWFEFNDKIVRPFDAKDIPDECFGGVEEYVPRGWSYGGNSGYQMIGPQREYMMQSNVNTKPILREKSNNAYVLFYDRIKTKKAAPASAPATTAAATPAAAATTLATPAKSPAKSKPASPAKSTTPASTSTSSAAPASSSSTTTDLAKPTLGRQVSSKAAVPPQLFTQIWQQNTTYWRDRAVFDSQYFLFLWGLISESSSVIKQPSDQDDLSVQIIEFSTRFVFQTLARAYQRMTLPRWAEFLRKAYSENVRAGVWLIEAMASETNWNADFLLICPVPEVRKSVASLVCKVLETVSASEQDAFLIPPLSLQEQKEAKENKTPAKVVKRGAAAKYIDNLVFLLKWAPVHWKKYDQYFRVLSGFAELGEREAGYLLQHNFLARLIDFYLGDESPLKEVGDMPVDSKGRRFVMGGDVMSPDITYLLQLVKTLVLASDTEAMRQGKPAPPTVPKNKDGKPIKSAPLSDSAQRLLLGKEFLNRLLVDGPTSRKRGYHVSAIINHHAWENPKFSKEVISVVMSGIEELSFDDVRPLFRTFAGLLNIKDSIRGERIDWALSALLATMKQQDKYWKITDLCIEHLIRLAKKNDDVYNWLRDHVERWTWVVDWITAFPNQPGHMDTNISLHKPGRGSSHHMSMWSPTRGFMQQFGGLSGMKKRAVLELLREGKEIDKADASDSDEDLSERVFKVGQMVDCKDTASKWLVSKVLEVKEGQVLIHYEGWSAKWDEWIDTDNARITKLHRWTMAPMQPNASSSAADVSTAEGVNNAAAAAGPEGQPTMAVVVSSAQDPV